MNTCSILIGSSPFIRGALFVFDGATETNWKAFRAWLEVKGFEEGTADWTVLVPNRAPARGTEAVPLIFDLVSEFEAQWTP